MLPYSVLDAVTGTMRQRTDWMEAGQTLQLAVRLTPTTVDPVTGQAAQRCPACWDDTRKQTTVPNDPVCLGTGWIIPASATVRQQGGYLTAVPLPDAFVNDREQQTSWTPQGVIPYTAPVLFYEPGPLTVKKFDLIIRTGPTLPHSRRYVAGDEIDPETLGASILYNRVALEYREPGNIVYLAPPADLTGRAAGQWGT